MELGFGRIGVDFRGMRDLNLSSIWASLHFKQSTIERPKS